MSSDEQSVIDVTPHTRLFARYWGWEIRLDGVLVGSVVHREGAGFCPYVVTYRIRDASVVVERLDSFVQVVQYLKVNRGYIE